MKSAHKNKRSRFRTENVDPNSMLPDSSSQFRSPSSAGKPFAAKGKSPLSPRLPRPFSSSSNPSGNPLKRKLNLETLTENGTPSSVSSDYGVQVILRIKPLNNEEEDSNQIVQKILPKSISILDHTFTFDSIADIESTQQDIFQLVGLPLVENCLAGFNSSIFAYGQTGSGKTYTMWGPPSALSSEGSSNKERGLTLRVFERLFSRMEEEQAKHLDKQLNYQCRCSFLEIYNEQITDLLNPTQRKLQIREDLRTGVYVDCLTEENVCTMKDAVQLLIKGLSNRRTGATSMNAESSRSHCVFTCVVESQSKSMSDGLSSIRISRINLVDLAGSERQKLTGAAGERLKEAANINRSLSQLGNLINILAEVSQSGKQRHIPYRDSRLTFLLQESLGGNAKLVMICAISPSPSCKNETFSTLRFAHRAKAIKNKAVINERTQDDVNVLREQICQLKDELLRMKSTGTSPESNGSYSTGWNARRSLNLLRLSLNHPRILPAVEDDSDEEMEIDEDDVEGDTEENGSDVQKEIVDLEVKSSYSTNEMTPDVMCRMHKSGCASGNDLVQELIGVNEKGCETEKMVTEGRQECEVAPKSNMIERKHKECKHTNEVPEKMLLASKKSLDGDSVSIDINNEKFLVLTCDNTAAEEKSMEEVTFASQDFAVNRDYANLLLADPSHEFSSSPNSISPSSLSIVPCQTSPLLQPPTLSISPKFENISRKSLKTSLSVSASQKTKLVNSKSGTGLVSLSFSDTLKSGHSNAPPIQRSENSFSLTEHLEASLHRGLQIIDNSHHGVTLRRSSLRFPTSPVDNQPLMHVAKVDIGIQTLSQESDRLEDPSMYICSYCNNKPHSLEFNDVSATSELQLVPIDGSQPVDKYKIIVPKAVEKVLAGAIRREMALEDHCSNQAVEVVQLNRLLQQYKHERECNVVIEQMREDKISRLEGLMDGILPTEEFVEEEFVSLKNEHKLLKEKCENHPEVLRLHIELKRVQDEIDGYRNFFDFGERDVLLEEIQYLRCQLQYYLDSPTLLSQNRSPLQQLTHSIEPNSAPLSTISELTEKSSDEKHQEERRWWTEIESKWISLSEELRVELEANRSLAEKRKLELDSEKKCSEELNEVLQTAMQGNARILEHYTELQEKHLALLGRHRKMMDGMEDVKKAAARAGVKGSEAKFIKSLAAEISSLKTEREKERRYWRDANKGLQAQLRDTAEAVQAAGELLVRLKEAEEAAVTAQKRASMAKQETKKAYQEIDNLRKNHQREIITLKQFFGDTAKYSDTAKYDEGEIPTDHQRRRAFAPFSRGDGEF